MMFFFSHESENVYVIFHFESDKLRNSMIVRMLLVVIHSLGQPMVYKIPNQNIIDKSTMVNRRREMKKNSNVMTIKMALLKIANVYRRGTHSNDHKYRQTEKRTNIHTPFSYGI